MAPLHAIRASLIYNLLPGLGFRAIHFTRNAYIPRTYASSFVHRMAVNCIRVARNLNTLLNTLYTTDCCCPTIAHIACWCRCLHKEEVSNTCGPGG